MSLYPYDPELYFMFGRVFLKDDKDIWTGLDIFTGGFLVLFAGGESIPATTIDSYLNTWGQIQCNEISCTPYLRNLFSLIHDPQNYAKQKKVETRRMIEAIKRDLLKNFQSFFSIIKKTYPIWPYGQAVFLCLSAELGANCDWPPSIVREVAHHLYKTVYNDLDLQKTPTIILTHAADYLFLNKKYESAIELIEIVLKAREDPSDLSQETSCLYNLLGNCFAHMKQNEKALPAFQRAFDLNPAEPACEWNLVLANIKCGNYDNAVLETLKHYYEFSATEREKHHITLSHKSIRSTYQYALEKAGRIKELDALLFETQQKAINAALEKRKHQGACVKAVVEEHRRLKEHQYLEEQRQKDRLLTKREAATIRTIPSYEEPSPWESSSGTEKYKAPEKKIKQKRNSKSRERNSG